MKLIVEYLDNYNLEEWGELCYAHKTDSCLDIRAAISKPITLKPQDFVVIPNGFKAQIISENDLVEIQIRGRSGLAAKHGIGLVNGIGTIDYDYRGEIRTIIKNNSNQEYIINSGDKIAQMAIVPIFRPLLKIGKVLDDTNRGTNGFGSTGKK